MHEHNGSAVSNALFNQKVFVVQEHSQPSSSKRIASSCGVMFSQVPTSSSAAIPAGTESAAAPPDAMAAAAAAAAFLRRWPPRERRGWAARPSCAGSIPPS